jgi:hypothetical protein
MASTFTLPEKLQIVEALAPASDAAGRTGDWIKVTNAAKAYFVATITQGHADTVKLTPQQATTAGGVGVKALDADTRIWSNLDTATADGLTRRTDAKDYTTDAGVKNKIVVIEIDPSDLDIAGGFTWVSLTTGASNALNITQAIYIGADLRFAGAVLPTAIA